MTAYEAARARLEADIRLGIHVEKDDPAPSIKPGDLTEAQISWLASWLAGCGYASEAAQSPGSDPATARDLSVLLSKETATLLYAYAHQVEPDKLEMDSGDGEGVDELHRFLLAIASRAACKRCGKQCGESTEEGASSIRRRGMCTACVMRDYLEFSSEMAALMGEED